VNGCRVWTHGTGGFLRDFVAACLPEGDYRRVFVKPNWVRHQVDPAFPIEALVTDTRLVEATIEACLEKYRRLEALTVADAPLLDCDFRLLEAQAGIGRLRERFGRLHKPRIEILDLRAERARRSAEGYLERFTDGCGDPLGIAEVVLGTESLLDEITTQEVRFRVSDYDALRTRSHHRPGFHRYRIAASALASDLFVNLPKMKTHQKAGITGALKNLVGVVADKSCLTHFRTGKPEAGGDEFAPGTPVLMRVQSRMRERLQSRSRVLFRLAAAGWRVLRRFGRVEVRGLPEHLQKRFYAAGGAWWGNDTIWRMIYDLNRILCYAPAGGGHLGRLPQRDYVAILDGMVAGEGNGPLQPLPVRANVLIASKDPFLADTAMAALMGFDWERIPALARRRRFGEPWGCFETADVRCLLDNRAVRGIASLPVIHGFLPPPGWRGRIERTERRNVA
jgi:hypothetical protein